MKELIKVTTNEQGQKLVSARELYLGLELNKAHWKRWSNQNIIENDFFKENEDWVGFTIMVNGNKTQDFAISLEFAKHIAMMARTEKSHEYRNYFLECEKIALQQNSPSYLIEDSIERAKRWIEEEQQRRLLQQTNEQLLITTEKQAQEIKHKDEVILGLTKNTPRPELRKRINQIIRYGAKSGYPRRYGIAYNEFDLTYKKNVSARLNHAIEKGVVKPSTNRMEYICEHMGMTWEFYQVVVRVFEGDLRQLSLDILESTSREN